MGEEWRALTAAIEKVEQEIDEEKRRITELEQIEWELETTYQNWKKENRNDEKNPK